MDLRADPKPSKHPSTYQLKPFQAQIETGKQQLRLAMDEKLLQAIRNTSDLPPGRAISLHHDFSPLIHWNEEGSQAISTSSLIPEAVGAKLPGSPELPR